MSDPAGARSAETRGDAAPSAATLTAGPLHGSIQGRRDGLGWVAPVAAATVLVGVAVVVLIGSQPDAHGPAASAGNAAALGSVLGSWRLVAADDGQAIAVPATPAVSITFGGDGTAVIWTGVNAINATVEYEPGAVTARFRLTTAVHDGSSDPRRKAILRLLDALAPSASPAPAVRSSYRVEGDHLTVRVSAGTLEFARVSSAPGQPVGVGAPSSMTAAPAIVEPS